MRASGVHVTAGNVEKDSSIRFVPYPDPYRRITVAESLDAVRRELAVGDADARGGIGRGDGHL